MNIEVAQIKSVVVRVLFCKHAIKPQSKSDLGEMRLDWWKEILEAAYDVFFILFARMYLLTQDNPPQFPVAVALSEAMKTTKFTKAFFSKILNARVMF